MEESETDQVSASVRLPHEFPGTLGNEEFRGYCRWSGHSCTGREIRHVRKGQRLLSKIHTCFSINEIYLSKPDHRKVNVGKRLDCRCGKKRLVCLVVRDVVELEAGPSVHEIIQLTFHGL